MNFIVGVFLLLSGIGNDTVVEAITPYKGNGESVSYEIPASSRYVIPRHDHNAPDIVYYMSMPTTRRDYPIMIMCGGSSNKDTISSIIHLHRYFLQECIDLGLGVITVEQWGVDGEHVDTKEFIEHYTRSQRLADHNAVIEYVQKNPPLGWSGKFVFLGISEGGALTTQLTSKYGKDTLATMQWSSTGDWNWHEELWAFIKGMRKNAPWWLKLWDMLPDWMPYALDLPKNEQSYTMRMKEILANPCVDKEFMGMTYQYHADALQYPAPLYEKLRTPLLVVTGVRDTIIDSSDDFVEKALKAGVNITYFRIEDMDHYIRTRPDVIKESLAWLAGVLNTTAIRG